MAFSRVLVFRIAAAVTIAAIGLVLLLTEKPWSVLARIGQPSRVPHFVAIYEWWAAALNAFLLAMAALLAPWWMRPMPPAPRPWLPAPAAPRWFLPLVAAAMALTALWGVQRLPLSLWDDEESSLRRVILGEYRRDAGGEIKLREVKWQSALWNYKKPANHQFQTILSKLCLDGWRGIVRPTGLQFREWVVRLPCFVAGVLSIGAVAILLRQLGYPAAGVIAAFLLALHPWHVRYAVELRGYVFTLLFGPLMLYALLRALDSGRWRWWLAFAGSEFALLYSYPGCLYMVVAANLCGAVAVLVGPPERRREQFLRLAVASTFAGMIYLQAMLPCIPQLLEYFKTERALGELSPRWHRNMLAHLTVGIPWNNSDMPEAGYNELQWVAEAHPWTFTTLSAAGGLFLVWGTLRMLAARPAGWMFPFVFVVPALLVYAVSKTKNHYLYEWYLIFVLPALAGLAAMGVDGLARLTFRIHRLGPALVAIAVLAIFARATHSPRRWLVTHPLQAMRESVLLTRPTLDPLDSRQQEIVTLSVTGAPLPYDGNLIEISRVDELVSHARAADREGKILYVNFANAWAAAAGSPELFRLIEDDRRFEKTASIQGFDPTLTAYVRRYRPGTLSEDSP